MQFCILYCRVIFSVDTKIVRNIRACFIALFCTPPEYILMKRPKKWIWTSSEKYSEEEAIKHDKFNMALHRFFYVGWHNWSFRWFIGKFSYVRSFEWHDCNYVLCFGIDVKTRITKTRRNRCVHNIFLLCFPNLI